MNRLSPEVFWPLLIVVSVFFASGQSEIATPGFTFSVDKIAHFGVFGALATSVIRIPRFRQAGWKGVWAGLLLVSLWGAMDEFRQSFTPGRSVEVDDWLADSLGALVAVVLYRGWPAYRRLLESRPFKRRKTDVEP
ncbi:VanZ family protein [Kiritimatiellaeota bacterium B1221]|nr:VanZ family protein [Kiritimatiellaeota bacterium B1221]